MSNTHILTKTIDHELFLADLSAAGVTSGVAIGGNKVFLNGPVWDAMSDGEKAAELSRVAAAESAHSPNTVTEVEVDARPHLGKLQNELMDIAGVTNITVACPVGEFPATLVIRHNPLDESARSCLRNTVLTHDASAVGRLIVDNASQVIAADGEAYGTVKVGDTRGAAAEGKTVRLRIPPGGSAGVGADRVVLDADGEATVTFQPTSTYTGELTFEFYYDNAESDPVQFAVRRGT